MSVVRLGIVAPLLIISAAHADTSLLPSKLELTAQNAHVIVIHEHDVKLHPTEHGTTIELNSTLRIMSRSDTTEISKQDVMPLTALVNLDGGKYFAGLSSLKTLSFQYNFVLFTEDGRIVTTALVTRMSGHCHAVTESVTNYIGWFDENAPDVKLVFDNRQVKAVIVKNPYDRAPDATRPCTSGRGPAARPARTACRPPHTGVP